jgi:sigma-B regulation protein RsbU (phosphoserine phosphatase)
MPEDATLPPHAPETAPPASEKDAAINRRAPELEGDYRPASGSYLDPVNARVDTGDYSFLLRFTEALNTTLDLRTLLKRTSELIRSVIQYRIFAILLLDETGKELRMRFQIGHTPEVERMKIPIGEGGCADPQRDPHQRRLQR